MSKNAHRPERKYNADRLLGPNVPTGFHVYRDPVAIGLLLIHAGVGLDAEDCTGSFALLEAVRENEHGVVTMLIDRGAVLNVCNLDDF